MTVQIALFVAYFVVVFGVGWYCLRLTRDETDYWIAGGKLGWLLGGASMGATHASAGTFVGTIGVIYTAGWSFAWIVLSIPIAYWFMAAVLAPRFTRTKELTLPAFMEARYDSTAVRRLAAVIILVATVVYVQAQIVAGGIIANIVFGVPTSWGMVGFTIILLAYTSIGGMLAVVYTDFIQLVIMIVGIVTALPLALRHVGGIEPLFAYVQAVKPETFTWESFPPALLFTMGLAFTLGTIATPEKLVRLYAMKDMRAIRRGVLLAIIVATGLNLMIFVIGPHEHRALPRPSKRRPRDADGRPSGLADGHGLGAPRGDCRGHHVDGGLAHARRGLSARPRHLRNAPPGFEPRKAPLDRPSRDSRGRLDPPRAHHERCGGR